MNTYQHTSTENLIAMREDAYNDSLALIWSNPIESAKLGELVFKLDREIENRKIGLSKDLSQVVDDTPVLKYQIRFYHSGDYENNQSEEYLKHGAFHGGYQTIKDAINELHRLDAYNMSVYQEGSFEYDENGQISGWVYSSPTLTWGFRYWIVQDTPEPKDLSQTAMDYASEPAEEQHSFTLAWYSRNNIRDQMLRDLGLSVELSMLGTTFVSGLMTYTEKELLLIVLEAHDLQPDNCRENTREF